MTTTYLFCFGYETPAQSENNAAHGWDDEDSAAVWIKADSDQSALDWGRSVAEAFVSALFRSADKQGYSWKIEGFAHGIEKDPNILAHALDLPVVPVGEMPDFNILSRPA